MYKHFYFSVSECLQNKEAKPVSMKCLRCEKQDFKSIQEFNEHTKQCYRYNQILKSVKFKCNLCESDWSTSEVLHYHLYSEHNSPAVVCDVCGTIIQNHYYLEKHIDRVHRKTKAFQCEKCDKNFTTKNGLDRHTKNVHLKIKPYTCDLCDYATPIPQRLETHVISKHTKNPEFKCHYENCDFVTNIFKRLTKHITTVHAPIKSKQKIIID